MDFHYQWIHKATRLAAFDYSCEGSYYITSCTVDRCCLFGEISGDIMSLNELGQAVAKTWLWLPEHFACVDLDEWVVMPNHIHGIIVIRNQAESSSSAEKSSARAAST